MNDSIRCYRDDHALYREVQDARRKAHEKHGANSIEVASPDSPRWLAILVEEIGEVANSLTYDGPTGNLRAELIDILAVASAWVSAVDRERAISTGHAPTCPLVCCTSADDPAVTGELAT